MQESRRIKKEIEKENKRKKYENEKLIRQLEISEEYIRIYEENRKI